MALDKRLRLGGLQVGGPRTMQNPARFRVADNIYQTKDDYIVPRNDVDSYLSSFSCLTTRGLTRFNGVPFILGHDGGNFTPFYNTTTEVPHGTTPDQNGSLGPQYVEKLGCLFVNFPGEDGGLFKYDGRQFYRAGVPLPYFSCAQYNSAGTTFVRVIQHKLDFQGNNIYSGYVQFPATPNGSSQILVRLDKNATDIVNSANSGVSPSLRDPREKLDDSYDTFYAINSGSSHSATELTLTTAGNHSVSLGAYLLIYPQLQQAGFSGLSQDAYAVALKVKNATATTVVFDLTNALCLTAERVWEQRDLTNQTTLVASYVTNYWVSVWTSTSSTGNYVWKAIAPVPFYSTANFTQTISVSSPTSPVAGYQNIGFVLAGNLGDIYNVTTVKQVFPASPAYAPISFTTLGDLALIAYENEIYHSDVSRGGAFEMTTASSFVNVGEGDDGNIQAICGTSDFLLVSRQFKNYYVAGNLPTANYRVAEVELTSLGCYSNESCIAVGDKVIFLNKQGIWALYSGGRCQEASEQIRGLFDSFSYTYSFPEENYFNLDSYPTFAQTDDEDEWLRVRLDVNRNLLFFLIKGDGSGTALVLNLNSGEFYTWTGLSNIAAADIYDIMAIDGNYYITQNGTGSIAVAKEDKGDYGYFTNYPPVLQPSWFTAGEPSLDKKLNQIKIFGLIKGSFSLSYELDWKTNASVSDGTYSNADEVLYSHKKRFTPANFQSVSPKITVGDDTERFQIEGIEIEWQPLQESMKR
jgi:hypothetical protein